MSHTSQTDTAPTKTQKFKTNVIPMGFALFAMFFGAGNLIFPLAIGAQSGQHLLYATLGFLLFGVGAPFLGLFATSLFKGNYETFFYRLGKIPGFLFIAFLMIIIGPLTAMPRTEVITYQTIATFLPTYITNPIFSLIFCGLVFVFTYKETRFMNVLGYILSPIKLISLSALILVALFIPSHPVQVTQSAAAIFTNAVVQGYNTMDMLAAFFFCAIVFASIEKNAMAQNVSDEKTMIITTLKACFVGATCLSVIYIGFIWIASLHAHDLQDVTTDRIIGVLSHNVLGHWGALLVSVCITFACFATAMALAAVTSNFFHFQVFRKKLSRVNCLAIVIIVMYVMSNFGFAGIMAIATPILIVAYPALIVLCVVNILYKLIGFKFVKTPVVITLILSTLGNFI